MKKLYYILICFMLISPLWCYALEDDISNLETVTLESCKDLENITVINEDSEKVKIRLLNIDIYNDLNNNDSNLSTEINEYTCNTLTNAKKIELEYPNTLEEDVYGRKFAWLFLDDELLQDLLVSKGYAKVTSENQDKYLELLINDEQKAKDTKLGIWNDDVATNDNEITDNNKEESKNKVDNFFSNLLGKIFDFIDDILESLLKMIEKML